MTDRPQVIVCQPRYGNPSASSRDAYWFCSDRSLCDVVRWHSPSTSITPHCFNMCLADALDLRDAGKATHMAMLHDDVCPEPGVRWLDELADEMVRFDLEFISAVIPIKDGVADPPTSTAIGDAADPWRVVRRIHLSERAAMPETFFPANVCQPGEVLLVNTGLWLADLRHPAWDAFAGFDTCTRVVVGEDGRRRAEMRPEDWELSRHLAAHGVRYGATWRVPLWHEGKGRWSNHHEVTA